MSELMRRVKNSQPQSTALISLLTAMLRAVLNALSRRYAELRLASATTTKAI
jgi:hypothetical protein